MSQAYFVFVFVFVFVFAAREAACAPPHSSARGPAFVRRTKYPGIYTMSANVADGFMSFITRLDDQVAQFTAAVRADPALKDGFNAVGISQGGMVVRAYIEMVNDPPVHTFVSMCGVVGGEYSCPLDIDIIPFLCSLFEADP